MSRLRWATRDRLETKRKRRLHQLAQKFRVLDKLPEVIRKRAGFLRRRNTILAIGHGSAMEEPQ
jgi:hypothetical protein